MPKASRLKLLKPVATGALASVGKALRTMRQSFPDFLVNEGLKASPNTIPVPLPRRDIPTYLLPTNSPQPWQLMPMKAAAYAQYPNFFNSSCMFFGSLGRDVAVNKPYCIIRPTVLALDLAKAMTSLGVIHNFDIGQNRERIGDHAYVWPESQQPSSVQELKLFPRTFLRLHLRWDLHKPVWESPNHSLAQTPLHPFESLPLSTKNISRASQPVLATPNELLALRNRHPSGIFIMYHNQLGLIADATAEQYDVPALVMAHLGLPYSHVAQISAMLREKYVEERANNTPLNEVLPLSKWSMVDAVAKSLEQRSKVLEKECNVEAQRKEILDSLNKMNARDNEFLNTHDISQRLERELLAWELKERVNAVVSTAGAPQGPISTALPSGGGGSPGHGSDTRIRPHRDGVYKPVNPRDRSLFDKNPRGMDDQSRRGGY